MLLKNIQFHIKNAIVYHNTVTQQKNFILNSGPIIAASVPNKAIVSLHNVFPMLLILDFLVVYTS